jgi:glutamate-1-semialdehyde 2,1-aminomutase
MGGGLPCGAIGGTQGVMGLIERGEYEQVGTFNGNPLTMAASRAVLTEILVPETYARIDELQRLMVEGCERVIAGHDIPAHVVALGAKGCIVFSPTPIRNYRDFVRIDDRYSHAHWLIQHNGGVFLPPWGKSEQWLVSAQHTEDDVTRFLANFETFARALRS